MPHTILVVAGPTASGKSALGVQLAKIFNGEVINCDSVQMYAELLIGSARITEEEMEGVPHHLLGFISPTENFDVGKFIKKTVGVIEDIVSRGKLPIVVGGTSLYISSLLYGLADLPVRDATLRNNLESKETSELYAELKMRDAISAESLHVNDRVRIIRALEGCILSQEPISIKKDTHSWGSLRYNTIVVVPLWSRAELYDRIDIRSHRMVEGGIIEETRALMEKYGSDAPALGSIGYDESRRYLAGELSKDALVAEIAQSTRRFAKRQMTWLRNEPRKRGWSIRPQEGERAVVLEGDLSRFAKPGRIKSFSVLDITFKELVSELKDRLNQGVIGASAWFVPGSKVI